MIPINLLFNYTEITVWHGCSPVNLLHIFRKTFYKKTSGRLLLNFRVKTHSLYFINSRSEVFYKKNVLKSFTKFTGKRQSLQLYEKTDLGTSVFLWILRNLQQHLFYRTPLGDCFCIDPITSFFPLWLRQMMTKTLRY